MKLSSISTLPFLVAVTLASGPPITYCVRYTVANRHPRRLPMRRICRNRRTKVSSACLSEWFPLLEGIKFSHNWGGPVGVPRDWMPSVRFDPATRIGLIYGYTGQGVVTSNLAGRLMAGLISGCPTSLEALPLAQRQSPRWESKPCAGWLFAANRETLGWLVGLREFDDAGIRGPPAALLQIFVTLPGEAQLAFACRILPDSTYMNSSSRSGVSLCIGHRCER